MADESVAQPQRWAVRILAGALTLSIAVETMPGEFWGAATLKRYSNFITNRIGVWQGEWPLFAPDPIINNSWISAELWRPDGTLANTWNSPYWAGESGFEKFRNFRMLNYYNRLVFREIVVGQDLADYLLKHEFGFDMRPVDVSAEGEEPTQADGKVKTAGHNQTLPGSWQLVLHRNRLNISLPEEGGFPTREETTWVSTSKRFFTREYIP
jgi:hypothetical protein